MRMDDICIIEPRNNGVNYETEVLVSADLLIQSEVIHIQETGARLGCLNTTICHAMLLYHHFQSLKDVQSFDEISVIAAALALSIKKSGEDIDTKNIIHAVYNLKMGKNSKGLGQNLSEESVKSMLISLKKIQAGLLCEQFEKDLDFETAHYYVFKYLLQYKSMPEVPDDMLCEMSSFAMKVLGTFYMSEKCIKYTAEEIAVACIHLTLVVSDCKNKVSLRYFKKEMNKEIDKDSLQDILDDLIVVCDVCTAIE